MDTPDRHRVLLVLHSDVNSAEGGVENYVKWLMQSLHRQFLFYVLIPTRSDTGRSCGIQLLDEHLSLVEELTFSRQIDADWISESEREAYFSRLLHDRSIDLVHFHHLFGHPLALLGLPALQGVPAIVSAHDFYLICSHYHLEDKSGKYCGVDQNGLDNCDDCLWSCNRILRGGQATRTDWINKFLDGIDRFHFPLNFVETWHRQILLPELFSRKTEVRQLPTLCQSYLSNRDDDTSQPLRIAVPGNFIESKGSECVKEAIVLLKDENVVFQIHGSVSDECRSHFENFANVTVVGGYSLSDVPNLLGNSDISLHLSRVPETFSFTLSEAWANNVVPIASDIGAFSERIEPGVDGFVVKPDSVTELVKLIYDLERDRSQLSRMRIVIGGKLHESKNDHGRWLKRQYRQLIETGRIDRNQHVDGSSPPEKWARRESRFGRILRMLPFVSEVLAIQRKTGLQ